MEELTVCKFRARGVPRPQGSKRSLGGNRMVEMSKHVRDWRTDVTDAAFKWREANEMFMYSRDTPLRMQVHFFLPRRQSHYGKAGDLKRSAPMWVIVTPDLDKLLRATCDALCNARLFSDDKQIVRIVATKAYESPFTPPGADFVITPIDTREED